MKEVIKMFSNLISDAFVKKLASYYLNKLVKEKLGYEAGIKVKNLELKQNMGMLNVTIEAEGLLNESYILKKLMKKES